MCTYDNKTMNLDMQRARFAFKLKQMIGNETHIVYIDESSFNNWHCRLCDKEIRGTDKRDADRHV